MMQRIPSFDPSQATNKPFIDVGAANEQSKVLLYNESPYNLDLDFYNGNNSILHAWEARYWTLDGDTKQIGWTLDTALNVTSPPISLVMGELYGPQEVIEGSYPMALIRQASVGNQVTTSNTNTLTNTSNAAGSNVVTLASTAATGNTFTLTNDGLLHLLVTIAGALTNVLQSFEPAAGGTLLQEGAATYLTEQLGNFKVDGTTTLTGIATLTAAPQLTAKNIQDGSGNKLADWSGTGAQINSNPATAGRFNYSQDGTNQDWWFTAHGSGVNQSASGTYNHNVKVKGAGVVPDSVWQDSYTGVAPGSQTISATSFTTTSMYITLGASLASTTHAWKH